MRQRLLNTGRAAFPWIQILSITLVVLAGCSKHDRSQTAMDTAATSSAALAPAPAAAAPAGAPDITPIRGTLASVSDSALTVSTAAGDVRVMVQGPLRVFARVPAKLSSVTPSSFVGVTSVAQPDGSERATEIHIFPEELRGTGEGSYPMTQGGGKDSTRKPNTMTNGTVSGAQKPGTTPQMTNGTIATKGGNTLTVEYRGGSKTITIPANVSVTALAPVSTKPTSGTKVVVLGLKQPDGTMKASSLVIADSATRSK